MADEEGQSRSRRWMYWAGGGTVVVLLIVWAVTGGPDEVGPRNGGGPVNGPVAVNRESCRRQLEGTLEPLRPTRLGISSSAPDLAGDLNVWWKECGASAAPLDVGTDALSGLLNEDVVARAVSPRFDERDVAHIRDCLLCRARAEAIVAAVRQGARTQDSQIVERVTRAFDFAVRQIADVPPGSNPAPVPCMVAALFGRAEPRYRAWLFAELLRQFPAGDGVDCVIIEPAGVASDNDAPMWLVGVIVAESDVYLFDPSAGIAIPGPSDGGAAGTSRPATLREVRADDGLLRRVDVPDGPAYPWTADSLRHVRVQVIGDSSWWSPRMARIQNELPGEYSMTLFDGLTDSPYRSQGLIDRVRQAGADGLWTADDVTVWDFPEAQTSAYYQAGGERQREIAERMRVLDGPRILQIQGEVVVETSSDRPLRMVRFEQLVGDLTDALQDLGRVRSAASVNPVTENDLAKEDAVYWIGLCQYEMHREEPALSNLDIYIREYPAGIWLEAARTLRALCLARLERYEEAAEALLEKDSLSFGEAFLLRQWQTQAAGHAEGGNGREGGADVES